MRRTSRYEYSGEGFYVLQLILEQALGVDVGREMQTRVRPQVPITSPHQFPTLTTEINARNAEIGLAAGLGLVTFQGTTGPATWSFASRTDSRCVVILANDVRAERIYPEVVRMILGPEAKRSM